ncbi:MAG TPA: cytochrome c oxidase assembly protein [Microbacteriaceae bacterium]|nr:cytochrome c oxidase assembly protein [Microbacteriaceae bacterium]
MQTDPVSAEWLGLDQDPVRPAPPRPRMDLRRLWPLPAAAAPVAIVVATVAILGPTPYRLLHDQEPGLATSMLSALLRLSNDASCAVTLGSLAVAAFVLARKSRTGINLDRDLAVARVASIVWLVGSALSIGVDGADQEGLSLSKLFTPGALGYLITASYLPGAWIASTCCAGVVFVASWLVHRWTSVAFLAAVTALAGLAPVMVGQVLVGPNHDFASDATIFATPAAAILFGAPVAMLARWHAVGPPGPQTIRRLRRLVFWCAGVAAAGDGITYWVQSAGRPLTSATGLLFLPRIIVPLAAVAIFFVIPRRLRRGLRRFQLAGLAAACALALGVTDAMVRIPPPVFFGPTDAQDQYLGYSVNAPLNPASLFLGARVNILFLVMAVAGVACYLGWLRTLRRRGESWPAGRTVAWLLGWAGVVVTTSSGVGPYSAASYAVHMGLHMSLNMLCPLLLVLGGPVTLALRALRTHAPSEHAGAREWLEALRHSRLNKIATNPMLILGVFVGSYYAIYLTPFFGWAMRYHWAHQAMTVEYLEIGYAFFALVIGVDEAPRPLPHLGKLGLVLAAMPFHAFFGVIVMTAKAPLAGLYFHYLDPVWLGNLMHDQQVAGAIAWSASEVPLLVVVILLVAQWTRQDARSAARAGVGIEASRADAAYDQMLVRLAERRAADPVAARAAPRPNEKGEPPR